MPHTGAELFGGMEIKPDFSHSEVVLGQMEKKSLDLERQAIGLKERLFTVPVTSSKVMK